MLKYRAVLGSCIVAASIFFIFVHLGPVGSGTHHSPTVLQLLINRTDEEHTVNHQDKPAPGIAVTARTGKTTVSAISTKAGGKGGHHTTPEETETTAFTAQTTEETTETPKEVPEVLSWSSVDRRSWPTQRGFERPNFGQFQANQIYGAPQSTWRATGHNRCCNSELKSLLSTNATHHIVTVNGTEVLQYYDVFFDPRFQQILVSGRSLTAEGRSNETRYDMRCVLFDAAGDVIESTEKLVLVNSGYTTVMRCPWNNRTAILPAYFGVKEAGQTNVEAVVPVKWAGIDQLAICLGTIYNSQDWLLLLQFFEYYRQQGVSKFYVAFKQISPDARVLIDYYKQLGYVDETVWPDAGICKSPVEDLCKVEWCNQCEERTGQLYTYTLVCDQDEFLYTDNMTLIEFLLRNDKADIGSLVFRPRYFPQMKLSVPAHSRMLEDRNALLAEIPMVKYVNATHYMVPGHTVKAISKSKEVSLRFIHYVQEYVQKGKVRSLDIDPGVAYIRHYRNYTTWGENYINDAFNAGNFSIRPLETHRLTRLIAGMHESLIQIFGY